MKTDTLKTNIVNAVKNCLLRAGKQVYDTGKRIYYLDYNENPHRLVRENENEKNNS